MKVQFPSVRRPKIRKFSRCCAPRPISGVRFTRPLRDLADSTSCYPCSDMYLGPITRPTRYGPGQWIFFTVNVSRAGTLGKAIDDPEISHLRDYYQCLLIKVTTSDLVLQVSELLGHFLFLNLLSLAFRKFVHPLTSLSIYQVLFKDSNVVIG